jgi:hypothetical protein
MLPSSFPYSLSALESMKSPQQEVCISGSHRAAVPLCVTAKSDIKLLEKMAPLPPWAKAAFERKTRDPKYAFFEESRDGIHLSRFDQMS